MQRLIAHRILVAGGKMLANHVVTLADDGLLSDISPFTTELPATRYVDSTLVLLPQQCPGLPPPLTALLRSRNTALRQQAVADTIKFLATLPEAVVGLTRVRPVY